jgi:hypothetical protein
MPAELVVRLAYGKNVPWVWSYDDGLVAVAGPDALRLHTQVELAGKDFHTVGRFAVRAGEQIPFRLSCFRSFEAEPGQREPERLLAETARFWREWSAQSDVGGEWREAVVRSLITLKALTYGPAGGIAAAGTTSLPEQIGGSRNWDYRYCWIRDATFTLYAFLVSGLREEARQWREWLLRAAAGRPSQLQILYGVAGERDAYERELPWLDGYESSRPVRIGNAAHCQLQLDVFGELADVFHAARKFGIPADDYAWRVEKVLLDHLETALAVIAYALGLVIAHPAPDPLTAGALGATLVVLLAVVHLGGRVRGAALGAGVMAGQARQWAGVVAAGVLAASVITLGGTALGPVLRGATLPVVVAAAALGVLLAGAGVFALVTAREDAAAGDRA